MACTESSGRAGVCPQFDDVLARYAAAHSRLPKILLVRDEWANVGLAQHWLKRQIALWLGLVLSRAVFVQHCKHVGSWRMPHCSQPHFVFDRYFSVRHNLSLEWDANGAMAGEWRRFGDADASDVRAPSGRLDVDPVHHPCVQPLIGT